MQTAEEAMEIVRRLPKHERQRFFAQLDRERKAQPGEEEIRRGWDDLMALAGSINTGKVLVPFPTKEQLYDENW